MFDNSVLSRQGHQVRYPVSGSTCAYTYYPAFGGLADRIIAVRRFRNRVQCYKIPDARPVIGNREGNNIFCIGLIIRMDWER
jgi:hypothetical protein